MSCPKLKLRVISWLKALQKSEEEIKFPKGFKTYRRHKRVSKNDKYLLPISTEEIDRLNYQHYVLRHQLHANFTAPVEDSLNRGIKVLDIGCGGGVWTLEMARDFPASSFVGIDSEKRYLPQKNIPENCAFVVANTLKLPFPDNEFDYTFQRTMLLAYSPPEWIKAVAELIRVTKPGGMVELSEWDGIIQRPPRNYLKYQNAWITGTQACGLDFKIAQNIGLFLQDSLIEVTADYVSCPVGWHDRAGELMGRNMELHRLAMRNYTQPFMDMKDGEYDRWVVAISQELRESKSWINGYYTYGVKP
ncbi:S-adenosyl-L-methionine-dependent methyltransferase [Endogone sp. FLAS-F59071]|nr:S-adenosyl-L-methionine-dependent methyltransferase [Endogone sp. FLAS-F59071]|eukprot:RUS21932.1 S-adenosyl-L-methionine-dependent methyltransferase [Endogone sp. FLAS-F59071]